MLSVENVRSSYGRIEALHGVSIEVAAGEIVTLLGANGAGKTTLIRAISGVQPISAGRILLENRPIDRVPGHARVALGIAQVPEGRQLFAPLSVEDNLKLGAWTRKDSEIAADIDSVYGTFPTLAVNGPDDTSTGRWIPTTAVEQYSATLAKWFGVSSTVIPTVFPYVTRFATPDLGFMG